MRFDFRRVPGCVEWWCPVLPGRCHGAGADRVKVVEWGSGFLMTVGFVEMVLFSIVIISPFVSQSIMDYIYYSPVGGGNATYWMPTAVKLQRRRYVIYIYVQCCNDVSLSLIQTLLL